MFDFIVTAQAVNVISNVIAKDFDDTDFWDAPSAAYTSDPKHEGKLYIINPDKLNQTYKLAPEALIVTEQEKIAMLRAKEIIYNYSSGMPSDASISERLLVTKTMFPPGIFKPLK